MKNRAEIDGLRAVAVLPVLFFHAAMGCPGGYVGVDVFFVISGFLITSLIVKDLNANQFSIVEFWERRIRRILPALSAVVVAVLAAGWLLLFTKEFTELAESAIAQTLLMSNVYFWRKSGYFEQPAELRPLLHTWSLAVEEQFYLFFPLLLLALKRFAPKSLVKALTILAVASFLLSVVGTYRHPPATFFLLPSRAWELLIGALLAVAGLRNFSSSRANEMLSLAGLLSILAAVICFDKDTRFPGVAALLPCLGAGMIIWTNQQELTGVGRLLATKPFVFIGKISYSLYLWHWPIFVYSKLYNRFSLADRIGIIAVSFLLATLSMKFIEEPFRKRVVLKTRKRVFAFGAIAISAVFFASLYVVKAGGVPARLPADVRQYASGASDFDEVNVELHDALNERYHELGAGDKHKPVHLLVWGDSHAIAILPAVKALCKTHAVRGLGAVHHSTPPLLGYVCYYPSSLNDDSIPFNDAILAYVRKMRVPNVLLVANWGGYIRPDGGTDKLRQALLSTLAALKETGAHVWVMRGVPIQKWSVPQMLAATAYARGDTASLGLSLAEHRTTGNLQNPLFKDIDGPQVTVLDPTPVFTNNAGVCIVASDGKSLYTDDNHLSTFGSMRLRPLFDKIFPPKPEEAGLSGATDARSTAPFK